MTFIDPIRLWLLVGVAALVVAYVVVALRRRRYAVRFTNLELLASVAPRRPGWRRHVPAALYLLALGALVVGFARPERQERVLLERATVVLAIDVSGSMEATDVAPSRLEVAKEAAEVFLDAVPERINVGLVTFNEEATLRVPPTTDRDQVRRVVDRLVAEGGTAIGDAVHIGLQALTLVPPAPDGAPVPATVVLLSDGSNQAGRSLGQAAGEAVAADVPVSTIAFGTDRGVVPGPNGFGQQRVPVDQASLEALAEATGGQSFAAASQDELSAVYRDIGSSVGFQDQPREITAWFVGASLLVLVVAGGCSLVWFNRLP